MRTLGFRTHALLAFAAAVGVIAALGRPWYAAAPKPVEDDLKTIGKLHGPVDGLTNGIARWFSETVGATGWDSLGVVGTAIAAMAAVTAVGALGCLVPPIQGLAREALRYGALACFGLVLWKLIDTPGRQRAARAPLRRVPGDARGADRTDLRRRGCLRAAHAQPHGAGAVRPPAAPSRYETAGSAAPPRAVGERQPRWVGTRVFVGGVRVRVSTLSA